MTEALSPPSAAPNPSRTEKPCHLPTKRAAVADVHAPSVALPLRFILTGIAALLTGSVWLATRPIVLSGYHYGPEVLGVTHLFVLGWIGSVMMIVAVSYKLVPMFTLSEMQNPRRAGWSLVLLNTGLAGVFITILFSNSWKIAFAFIVVSGLALHGLELVAILRARKRRTVTGA